MKGKAACVMLALAAAVVMAGCSSLGDVTLTPCDDEPGWVSRGSGEFGVVEERDIFAVGSAFPSDDDGKAAEKADARAREALGEQAAGWVEAANARMTGELSEYFKDADSAAGFFAEAAKDVPAAVAKKGEVRKRWTCGVTGEVFSLMAVTEAKAGATYKKHVAQLAKEQGSDLLQVKPEEFVSILQKKDMATQEPSGDLSG